MEALAQRTRVQRIGHPIAFAGSPLDRVDSVRNDPATVAALKNRDARLLLLDGLEPRLDSQDGLIWGGLADADAELIFLGLTEQGHARFVAVPSQAAGAASPTPQLWQAIGAMTPADLAIYGTARSLAGWHARHRFCPVCGHPTVLTKAGWQRSCTHEPCRADHFPRSDPVVIMLVEYDGQLLLGRQPRFPPRRYSALAGFIEPGETLEEAVAREVFEEAGLRVDQVSYIASQPWPFPSSLMIGCHARPTTSTFAIDRNDLEDARWFTRAEVAQAVTAGERGEDGQAFSAPPSRAAAWHLLDWWLQRGRTEPSFVTPAPAGVPPHQ